MDGREVGGLRILAQSSLEALSLRSDTKSQHQSTRL
jgi:hypothetical protein